MKMHANNNTITSEIVGQVIEIRLGRPRSTLNGALLQALTQRSDLLARGPYGKHFRRMVWSWIAVALSVPLAIFVGATVLRGDEPRNATVGVSASVVAKEATSPAAAASAELLLEPIASVASGSQATGSSASAKIDADTAGANQEVPLGPLPGLTRRTAVQAPPPQHTMPTPQPTVPRPIAAPAPVAIGELVSPPPIQKPVATARADSRSEAKPPADTAGSLVIDVGERTAPVTSAASSPGGQVRQSPKPIQSTGGSGSTRPAQLREELATLPSRPDTSATAAAGKVAGESEATVAASVRFAEPVSERPAVAAVPAQASKKSVKITIVDISPDGNSVLVTDPATRLPKRYMKGERLPNGQTLQSIDAAAGRITAGGDVIRME